MKKLKIHVSGIEKLTKEALGILSDEYEIIYVNLLSSESLKASLNECDIFWFRLNHKLTRKILEGAKCKFILCAVTGLDHIDIDACNDFGIKVLSLKNETEFLKEVRATAEHTMCLMLNLIRRTKLAFEHVESGKWNRSLFKGSELYKKKVGILGLGRLGEIVANYAQVLGMDVYYYDIEQKNADKTFIKCLSLENLIEKVDILSIHLPYDDSTHFIINKDSLSKIKKTAYIINTSRGGVINENDILSKLKAKEIAGYATDVLYGEPHIENHSLVDYAKRNENVIITPHIGGFTQESIEKTEYFIAQKLVSLLDG
ncbi:NAD(P)-binding domain-containing protein [Seonamhaeicola sp. MEBiC1930]|uniref:NAD(P)-dependent oxidoreductase n=1 Tax=Seonamhaeicola sp. MEBiC01930 TaxID=2976768 RepID=UPI003253D21F